jgi:NAD+ synthase (glutamine-hydrolysing)
VDDALYNAAGVIHQGRIVDEYFKWSLPNYQVFDEKRYFTAGSEACVVEIHGTRVGLTVCEDIWNPEPAAAASRAGAQVLVNLNASPFHRNKQAERHAAVRARVLETDLPIVYVNQVGGQDELVFDGGSFVMDSAGDLVMELDRFQPATARVSFPFEPSQPPRIESGELISGFSKDQLAEVWSALVLGVRDYVHKNGFPGVVLGLSGGVDSALTLAIAEAALGADKVQAVMMPFRYTSQMSLDDAAEQAQLLGVKYSVLPIESIYTSFMEVLEDEFAGLAPDTTEENLQARARGVLLMSISNKTGKLVLTTGNKSEIAVGYSTLYGDMAGGFNVLKDVPKTLVFALCWYRNSLGPCIPERVITRPPSAELRPDQKDEDSLPAYEVLDQIIDLYVEQDLSAKEIIARGFDEDDVLRTIRLIDLNEYKRRQAPVGVRLTKRGFGRDRRYPITSRWRAGV